MIPSLRRRAAIPVCAVLNLLLIGACLTAYETRSADGSGSVMKAGAASPVAVVLRAKITGRIHDDAMGRLFGPPRKPGATAVPVQPRSSGPEPVRLVGIIASENAGESGIALVELADHRVLRLRTGAGVGEPGHMVRQVGTRSVEVDLGSGRRMLTLN